MGEMRSPLFFRASGQGVGLQAHQGTVGVHENRIAVRFAYEWHDTRVTGIAHMA